ncbi:hypothetical protein BSF43_57850 [Pseudomonas ogarae]|uniref:hypothetical protein n=1 Tax=Pseudomonas ogarae (strain DSM 112162 / CECT 30235 / F113) TaxID=1114970 RepID=UPI001141A703|nr:hypothetical protein [Pseudomonas ogarae]PBI97459.1 hypothetical protein BSF43_57850 [Pseudomonas ogarae]
MVRIPVTLADLNSGRIKNSVSKLSKHHPDQPVKPKRSVVQQTLAQILGYGGYGELRSYAKNNGLTYSGQPLAIEQAIASISLRIARYWSVSAEKAELVAAALGLIHLDAFRATARPVQLTLLQEHRAGLRANLPASLKLLLDAVRQATAMPMAQMAAIHDAMNSAAQMAAIPDAMKPMAQMAAIHDAMNSAAQMAANLGAVKPLAQMAAIHDAMSSAAQMAAIHDAVKPMAQMTTIRDAMNSAAQMAAIYDAVKPMAQIAAIRDAMNSAAKLVATHDVMKPMEQMRAIHDAMNSAAQMVAMQDALKPLGQIATILDALKLRSVNDMSSKL